MWVSICEGTRYEQMGIGETRAEAEKNACAAVRKFMGQGYGNKSDKWVKEWFSLKTFNASKPFSGYFHHAVEAEEVSA